MNVNFINGWEMPNLTNMSSSMPNNFQRKNSRVGKRPWSSSVVGTDFRNGHFDHKNTTVTKWKAKFYNLVRTISKAIKPDYVKVNDERDTFMSKLEGLVLDYRPWNHVEPFSSTSTSVVPWRALNRISVFMVAFPLLQFAICYIGAYLSQNALYKFLEEDMDQAHGQNSYVSDWKTYNNPSYLYV